ncbi:MAG TPA: dipeptide ABC transporter ATP-binding protein [Candidatus Dormibacteraeota bacterium]
MSTSRLGSLGARLGIRRSDADLWIGSALTPARGSTWRRARSDRATIAGAAIVGVLVLLAVIGPLLVRHDPTAIDPLNALRAPRLSFPFGTDNLGRDILSRVLAGARVSISLALLTGAAIVIVGVVIGAIAGYFGGLVDSVAMRVVDVLLAFPTLVLALAIAGALGTGYRTLVIALVVTWWPSYARLVRGGVLAEREREYVDAARGIGARPRRLIFRHILPNTLPPVIVLLSFDLGFIILAIAALGYLGVGVAPPTPEWGTMVADGREYVFSAPQMIVFPGLAIAFSVVGFNLLGEGLRNVLDPHDSSRRPAKPGRRAAASATRVSTTSNPLTTYTEPPLLEVADLHTRIRRADGVIEAVDGVSFTVAAGEAVGLVGESGCGKSMTALSILGLLPSGAEIVQGRVALGGQDLTALPPRALRNIRGADISIVFQDPMSSLNPTMTIGEQIADPVRAHRGLSAWAARERAAETLALVGMPRPREHLDDFPHQLSGGMRQRVMIACALVCEPRLLIADEPTTALDVTIQAQILALLDELRGRLQMGLLLITHDMGVVASHTDRVMVMYAGRVVESLPSRRLLTSARHRYTRALLESLPSLDGARSEYLFTIPGMPPTRPGSERGCAFQPRCAHAIEQCAAERPPHQGDATHWHACFNPAPAGTKGRARLGADTQTRQSASVPTATIAALDMKAVSKEFRASGVGLQRGRTVKAVSGVSLAVAAGSTLGLVGESGCGKSTLARLAVVLERPDSGSVDVAGDTVSALGGAPLRRRRRDFQLIFQNSYAALDPRMRVGAAIGEPLTVQGIGDAAQRRARVEDALREVGLDPAIAHVYPHELSGGQRQRVGFARALMLQPGLVVADEPVSALDVSIRSQLLNLMRQLQNARGLTYVLISHDLSVVRHLADVVAIMYLGKVVEMGPTELVYDRPGHPYTRGLIDSVPALDLAGASRQRASLVRGELPSAVEPPSGCRFRTRCPLARDVCASVEPELSPGDGGRVVACHFRLDGTRQPRPEPGRREPAQRTFPETHVDDSGRPDAV